MDGGHHLSSGVERSFADSGARLDEVILAHAQGIGVSDESGLGGLARDLAGVVYLSVGAKSHGLGYELLIVAEMIDDSHLVLGQSTRLVGADYLSAAESLNCGKLTDKSLSLAHRGNAYGKDYRDDCRQSLGYGRERRKRLKKDLQQYYLPKVLHQTPEGRLSAASRSEIVGKQIG